MPIDRDILRTDATAEYQQELDSTLRADYPLIDSASDLAAYKIGQTPYASFKLRENPLLPQIVSIALRRAADPCDDAFCKHADRHGNFGEVVEDLAIALKTGKLGVRVEGRLVASTSILKTQTVVHRLILEAARKKRTTYRPAPLQLHLELEKITDLLSIPEKKYALYAKTIRKAAGQYGIPFALLTCIYGGLQAKSIADLFDNDHFKKRILDERSDAGVKKAKIPSVNPQDLSKLSLMVARMRDFLVMDEDGAVKPRYHADDYFEALKNLDQIYQKDSSDELTKFVPSNDVVIPRTVFAGMNELAQSVALKEFIDPHRRQYIDSRYGNTYTTSMVTSYFDSHIDPQNLYFKNLIIG